MPAGAEANKLVWIMYVATALKKPFGALNDAYYGPTMVLKTINHFSPKMSPKVGGRQPTGPLTLAPRTIVRTSGEDS